MARGAWRATRSRASALDAFLALARRRRDGEPVAYLTGTREFWGLPLARLARGADPAPGNRDARRAGARALAGGPRRRACWISAPAPARSRSPSRTSGRARRSSPPTFRPTRSTSRATTRDASASPTSNSRDADWYDGLAPAWRAARSTSSSAIRRTSTRRIRTSPKATSASSPRAALTPGGDGLAAIAAHRRRRARAPRARRLARRRARLRSGGRRARDVRGGGIRGDRGGARPRRNSARRRRTPGPE